MHFSLSPQDYSNFYTLNSRHLVPSTDRTSYRGSFPGTKGFRRLGKAGKRKEKSAIKVYIHLTLQELRMSMNPEFADTMLRLGDPRRSVLGASYVAIF
ncbi:hypothetical protein E2C01_065563 [Portunus trituberculatus]|uniref:Uncharacterized protein n=1 Tax=Portunus trituberculatus TaxID=210409 RepID=A0A5B7HEY0_PORTR|nr:hypothetical protein [Portunus trituberculatus]